MNLIAIALFLLSTIEYYRFLHIQEQCCLKWQTSIFKFGQLKKEHDKCKIIRAEMQAKLQHLTQLLLKERQTRRNAEMERDFYVIIISGTQNANISHSVVISIFVLNKNLFKFH